MNLVGLASFTGLIQQTAFDPFDCAQGKLAQGLQPNDQ